MRQTGLWGVLAPMHNHVEISSHAIKPPISGLAADRKVKYLLSTTGILLTTVVVLLVFWFALRLLHK